MFSSITYMKAYMFRLAPMNGSNLWPATDYTQTQNKGKEQVKVSKAGKKQKCSLCKIEGYSKRACTLTRPPKIKARRKTKQSGAQAVNEGDEGSAINEGNQGNAMNEGDEVNEDDQAINDDGGAVNDGGEAVNEVHVQQHYDKEARETPIATLLKKIRRKKSEMIIKLKLGKKVGGVDAPRNSEAKPVTLE
ncbi:unnamed protein product [Lactuca virosa]|uniref:Uncharacterized protein n=1 Tax=Lactuca virosa TaxID=75947 RepID=A0AAU9LKU7_9ASTR|nr:unnamed protein product [Lactuca virosa]